MRSITFQISRTFIATTRVARRICLFLETVFTHNAMVKFSCGKNECTRSGGAETAMHLSRLVKVEISLVSL